MKKLSNLKKFSFSNNEMKEIKGGLFGLLCVEGVLDGIKGNTKVYFGKCRPKSNMDEMDQI